MDKLAELVRDSEVRGAMAAFVDLDLVKVASQEAFDVLVDAVCQKIGDGEYDLQKVASVTEELLSESEQEVGTGEEGQEKTALLGTTIGAARASNLSDEERAALIKHYGLHSDASLGWRNAGRGFVGGNLGALIGGAAGVLTKSPALSLLGHAAGFATGTKFMTDKYSKSNAQEIMNKRPKTAAVMDDIAQKAALGELLQMKVAGQIDEKSFVEAASSLLEKDASENLPKKKVFDAEVVGGKGKIPWKRIAKGGAVAAGLAGGAALGKSLYDKYSGKSKEGN